MRVVVFRARSRLSARPPAPAAHPCLPLLRPRPFRAPPLPSFCFRFRCLCFVVAAKFVPTNLLPSLAISSSSPHSSPPCRRVSSPLHPFGSCCYMVSWATARLRLLPFFFLFCLLFFLLCSCFFPSSALLPSSSFLLFFVLCGVCLALLGFPCHLLAGRVPRGHHAVVAWFGSVASGAWCCVCVWWLLLLVLLFVFSSACLMCGRCGFALVGKLSQGTLRSRGSHSG